MSIWKIILVALTLRLIFVFVISPIFFQDRDLEAGGDYDVIAKSLLEGKGFVYSNGQIELFRPPLYVVFVAAHYFLFGYGNWAIIISHILLSLISIYLIWRIALLVTLNEVMAKSAALFYSVYPFAIWRIPVILADQIIIPILLLCVYLFLVYLKQNISRNKYLLAAGIGLTLGALTLTKPVASLYPFCIVLSMLVARKTSWKSVMMNILIVLGVYAAAIIPWTIRNYAYTGDWPVIASGGGFILSYGSTYSEYFSLSDMSSEKYDQISGDHLDSLAKDKGWMMQESAEPLSYHDDKSLRNEMLGKMLERPGKAVMIYIKNLAFFWFLAKSQIKSILYIIIQLPLLFFSIFGIIKIRKQIEFPLLFIIFTVLYFWGASSIFLGAVRYSDPVIPFIMIIIVQYLLGDQETSMRQLR